MDPNLKQLMREMIEGQRKQLLKVANQVEPNVIEDDLWQPNDFPELENHPLFRYEEGYLAGLMAAEVALSALLKR